MKATTLFEALAVLRQLKDLPVSEFPKGIEWIRVMRAHNALDSELIVAGLQVPVEAEKVEA